ncbi:MAG TPA: hypothetical protein VM802_14410, partial [Chitinophaga sp.]|uniref:hypothetical protein n=1 Tax=Chitinophaga sp. TaxID=1869181 RepID=UPI002BDE2438
MKFFWLRSLCLLTLILLLTVCSYSQDKLYVVNGLELGYVDMSDYTYKKVVRLPTVFTDLAVTPDEQFYGVTGNSIYEIDRVTGDCTFKPLLGSFGWANSMVSDRNGDL